MENVNIGVIGTGHLGNLHTKLFKEVTDCTLCGIYDRDTERANKVGSDHNIKVFESLDGLLEAVDAVSIVTSTSAHYEIAKYALLKDKHVFLEKPITTTIEEADELLKIAEDRNLKIQVGHIERFNPALLSLEKYNLQPMFIQSDRLAQFNPRGTDVAVILDLMIHDIDIILSLVKSEVVNISASGIAVVSDSLDIANARIEFENGAVANVTASRISQKKLRKMRMFQKDKYIAVDFGSGVSEVFRLADPANPGEEHFMNFGEIGVGDKKRIVCYEQPEQRKVNALQYELQLFVDAVKNDTIPVVSGKDGRQALKVADMIISKIGESKV